MARALSVTALLIGGSLAILYAANTFLYLTPPNPVKLHLYPLIHAIEYPYFSQNWHLFAPNPVRTNFTFAVRCRLKDGATTVWHDPVAPLLATHHRRRLSPMGKVLRVSQNAIFALLGRNTDEWRVLFCKRRRHSPACRGDDPLSISQRDLGKFVLNRLGLLTCHQLMGPHQIAAVQVRIFHHIPPPISQRHLLQQAGMTTYRTLPWATSQP